METATFQTQDAEGNSTIISIDNTTNFKDFSLQYGINDIDIQIDSEEKTLNIGKCKLSGTSLDLFKKFIAQLD